MSKSLKYYTVFLWMLLYGQFCEATYGQPGRYEEKVTVTTDRNLYITGEKISFSAFLLSDPKGNLPLSRILYTELITPDGNKIGGNKFLLESGKASGSILIPLDINSGYYYLRAYTRYMRNSGPGTYTYCLIKIINPLTSNVLNHGTSDTVILKQYFKDTPSLSINILTNKPLYHYRDTVNLRISNLHQDTAVAGYTLAVVPVNTDNQHLVSLPPDTKFTPVKHFYPETRGLSLTGNLTNIKTGKPSPAERVNLVIIGQGKDFMSVQSDSNSNFYFALPDYTGFRDLLLSVDARKRDSLKIQVDNDFCPVQIKLPSPVFTVTDPEKAILLSMAVNKKLNNLFPCDTSTTTYYNPEYNRAFYGTPDEVLVLDQYVQLTSLEEYFNELAMYAKVKKNKGRPYFKVIGPQEAFNNYDPLVLVDWVAIDDPARILAISAQNVAKIEIINRVYVKGEHFYGGIISIISKKGDFAGIELPPSSLFINYRFLADKEPGFSPIKNSNYPDTRNTLFWEPDLHVLSDPGNDYTFITGDNPGNYDIIVKALYKDGKVAQYISRLTVSR